MSRHCVIVPLKITHLYINVLQQKFQYAITCIQCMYQSCHRQYFHNCFFSMNETNLSRTDHLNCIFTVFFLFTFSHLASSCIFAYPLLQPLLAILMSDGLNDYTLLTRFYYTSLSFNCSICSQVTLFNFTVPLPHTFWFHWGTSF